MKAHELARELGISQKELVNFLQQRRLTRNTAAPLAPGAIEAARTAFKPATVMTKIETNGDRRAVLPPTLSVKDLAEKLGVSPVEVIKKLMASKILATINQVIDFATAEIVAEDRKSTRLNSSHVAISYAVFCLKKKNFCQPQMTM